MGNKNLSAAKEAKKDEFYTFVNRIDNEIFIVYDNNAIILY